MGLKDMLLKAANIAQECKFKVNLGNGIKEMTYIELGTFLVSNEQLIDEVIIILKED